MTVEKPTVIDGRYHLEEVLGRGGMADVYRASDQVLGRSVAVKLLRNAAGNERDRARFTAEARTLAGLNHPNLVMLLDAGITAEHPYLILELVEGPTLHQECGGRAQSPERVAGIGAQVADALAFAHGRGVVHRDVKPANVLLGSDGRVRLADFGIARLLGDTVRHTETGQTIGTAAYLSPEQVQGQPVTQAADVYALGLVLLEAISGERAYPGSPVEAALARLNQPPALPAALTGPLRDLLVSMIDVDPVARPAAAEVASQLHALAGRPGAPRDPEEPDRTLLMSAPVPVAEPPTAALPEPAPTSLTRLGWVRSAFVGAPTRVHVIVAGLALLLVVLVVAALATSRSGPGTPMPRTEIPAGTPTELRTPLQHLHDAIEGSP